MPKRWKKFRRHGKIWKVSNEEWKNNGKTFDDNSRTRKNVIFLRQIACCICNWELWLGQLQDSLSKREERRSNGLWKLCLQWNKYVLVAYANDVKIDRSYCFFSWEDIGADDAPISFFCRICCSGSAFLLAMEGRRLHAWQRLNGKLWWNKKETSGDIWKDRGGKRKHADVASGMGQRSIVCQEVRADVRATGEARSK